MFRRACSFKTGFALAILFAVCCGVRGQEASRPDRGVMPNGSYAISDIENINVLNGNVNIRIPLASLPPIAGGKLSWTLTAQYNSKIWNVVRELRNEDPFSWQPYSIEHAGTDAGWSIGRTYTIFFRNVNDDFDRLEYPGNSGIPQWDLDLINNYQWWKVVLRMPDGSEHEFRTTDWSSYTGNQDFLRGFYNVIPSGSPMRYYSVDGTYMFASISSITNWTVYLPDGTQIIQTPDGVQRIQDTNGNKIKIYSDANGTHYRDEQTNREIRLTYNPAGQGQYQVWYKTVGGIEQHIDINLGTTNVDGKLYSIQLPGCENRLTEILGSAVDVVREIVFPQTEPLQQQRRFTFSYNSDTSTTATDYKTDSCPGSSEPYTRPVSNGLGELSRIVTPSGATVDYSYKHDGVTTFDSFGVGIDYVTQDSITQKKITHDGTTDTWTYNAGDSFGIVTGPDGSVSSESAYCSLPNTPGCATDKSGLTYRSVRPFTRIDRHWTNLAFSGSDNRAPNGIISLNPVVDKEYTTLTDGQGTNLKMSAKVSSFDYNGNVIQETFYDWFDPGSVTRDAVGVPTGVPTGATVLKVVNYSHYNQAASSSSGNVYAKRSVSTGAPLILNAPKEITLGSSIVQFSYDQQAYGVAPAVGNLTTKKVWDDIDAKWITTGTAYDLYGNVSTTTDGRQKLTQFFYDDSTHALPNRVVVDPQNGTGTQTTTTAYDFDTGLVISQTDANNQLSTINYTNQLLGTVDPFGRPGFTESPAVTIDGNPHKRRVTTTYLDTARQVIVETDLNTQNDKLLKTRTTNDQLGRPVLTQQTEDGINYTISVQNIYLDMGRVTLTSSAMRSTPASTDSWTRVTKDTAGRVKEIATFGGASAPAWTGTSGIFTGAVTTDYTANFTTVTDQAGKVRRSMVDALGRLVRVDEPDGNGSLGLTNAPVQPTSYSYDVFGNLTGVSQAPQPARTFTYDSLSRLRTAVNPESGTISYQYDDNSNLLVKTDAREVSTHFEYDGFNRVTRRWYNKSTSLTATAHNNPSLPSDVGATDEVKFYYDSQVPQNAPTYTHGPSVGRLTAQIYGSGTNGDYYAYDTLGRQTLKIQQTGTINYQLSANYSLSGALTMLTYPSGRTVTNSYDNAGRLSALSGNLGDGVSRNYATGIIYSSSGGLVKEQFGTSTAIYNKLFYNSRGQLAEIRASTSYTGPADVDANRGAIINSYSSQCSGMCSGGSMPDNNGNLKRQDVQIPSVQTRSQYYDYDELNRLKRVHESTGNQQLDWQQEFDYDRWGNRTINAAGTWIGNSNNPPDLRLNETQFDTGAFASTNRLQAPGDLALPENQRRMRYDAAGNLTTDLYTGAGNRTYDAENKITSAWGGQNQAQLYAYDASGQRIKRTVNGVQTWQVYGFNGELLAEYPANGAAGSPQKEYGYRNGQLLITAKPGSGNQSLSVNGTSAYMQMPNSSSLNIAGAITIEAWVKTNGTSYVQQDILVRHDWGVAGSGGGYELSMTGLNKARLDLYQTPTSYTTLVGNTALSTGAWHHIAGVYDGSQMRIYVDGVLDGSAFNTGPASGNSGVRVGCNEQSGSYFFNGLIDEVRVSNAAVYSSNFTPQMHLSATGNTAGLWKFDEQTTADSSANGNSGTLIGGATFSPDVPAGPAYHSGSFNGTSAYVEMPNSTSLNISGAITVEAWVKTNGTSYAQQDIVMRHNWGVSGSGGGYELSMTPLNKARVDFYQTPTSYTTLVGNTALSLGVWHHIAGVYDGSQIRLYVDGVLDGSATNAGPASGNSVVRIGCNEQGGSYFFNGLIDEVRVSNAALYTSNFTPPQTHLTASGSTAGLWKFDGQTTADSSVNGNNGTLVGGVLYSDDVPSGDGGGGGAGGSGTKVQWLITDQLGTPRMILDQSGDLDKMTRHDYLPFGEELFEPIGGRGAAQGYTSDAVRQQFTKKERDNETGLDYFLARYYSNVEGRFTSLDSAGPDPTNPQTFNKYEYSLNNPLRFIDPNGRQAQEIARLTQSIRDYFATLIRRFQNQLNPEEAQQERRPGPFGDGDKMLENYNRILGERVEFATDLMMLGDISGVGTFARGVMRNNRTETVIGMAGMVATPLNEVFGVGKSALTSGRLIGGRIGAVEVGAQFSKSGDTLVAGIVGLFNKEATASGLGSASRALLDSIVAYAKEQGLSKIEVQAIAVINPKLEQLLIKQGFEKTTVVVEGEKVAAYTKTFVVH